MSSSISPRNSDIANEEGRPSPPTSAGRTLVLASIGAEATPHRDNLRVPGVFLAVLIAAVLVRTGDLDDAGRVTPPATSNNPAHARPVRFTVEASGDLLIHSPVWERALALGGGSYDFAPLFGRIRPYVRGADLAVCHVETPMTSAPPASYPIFNTPPELARAIAETGWDVCDTASNHSLDQGQAGIDATGVALDRAGVAHNGSFPSAQAQQRPVIVRVHGVRLGFLAFTTDTNGIPAPHPWSVNVAGPGRIRAQVRRDVRHGAAAVIVNLHWGGGIVPEYQQAPSAGQVALVRKVARLPAVAAIVAQGPHVVQPIDWVEGKPVVYSEGNLISNQGAIVGLPAPTQDGLIALISFVARGTRLHATRVRYVPTYVSHPDLDVMPVGRALRLGVADPTELQASYARTVAVAGRGPLVRPIPRGCC
jgi:poly-gamma-glutamate capsule biosynthesis protein CapA/YwtB (metallophosphatase superfamily)